MAAKIKDLPAWLATRYTVNSVTGCWEWLGAKYPSGYGNTKIPGTRRFCMAHRLAYRIVRGTLDDALVIDHLCGNKGCINPDHMEPVTQGENLRRAGSIAKVVAISKQRGSAPNCPKGHPLSGENLYTYPNTPTHRACRTCMKAARREYNQSIKTKRKA